MIHNVNGELRSSGLLRSG